MVVALFVLGALGMPVTGLLVRPDVYGARHGAEMIVDLGRFGWYGYLAVSVVLLGIGLVRGRRLAATVLLALTIVLGTIHVMVVANGMFHGEGRPGLAAVAATAGVVAALALAVVRVRYGHGENPDRRAASEHR
jgi:hypothetical protein